MRRFACFLGVVATVVAVSSTGARADNAPTNGCPSGYTLIGDTQLGSFYTLPQRIDEAGNDDEHVCALALGNRTEAGHQLYLFSDDTLPASSH